MGGWGVQKNPEYVIKSDLKDKMLYCPNEFVHDCSCTVLDRNLWEYLKANKVRCASSKATKKLYSYGNKQPLQVAGTFTADVLVGNRVLNEVEFVVIESERHGFAKSRPAAHSLPRPGGPKAW